jgi:hypothetical protein
MAKPPTLAVLVERLTTDYPQLTFAASTSFFWSRANHQVMYRHNAEGIAATFSLLHEVGHALLDHKRYTLDFELLQLEVAAWEQAMAIAPTYDITIDEEHIQDCLDSYRDWLYRRSICPACSAKALQQDDQPLYRCFNCHATWQVAPSRFCRPYRRQNGTTTTSTAVFAAEL